MHPALSLAKRKLEEHSGRHGASSPPWGEAESARSAEPGEGSGAALDDLVPHPLAFASRPLPAGERRGARLSSHMR